MTGLVSLSLLSCQLSSTVLSSLLAELPVGVRELDLSGTGGGTVRLRAGATVTADESHTVSLRYHVNQLGCSVVVVGVARPCFATFSSHNPLSAASLASLASLILKQQTSCPLRLLDVQRLRPVRR